MRFAKDLRRPTEQIIARGGPPPRGEAALDKHRRYGSLVTCRDSTWSLRTRSITGGNGLECLVYKMNGFCFAYIKSVASVNVLMWICKLKVKIVLKITTFIWISLDKLTLRKKSLFNLTYQDIRPREIHKPRYNHKYFEFLSFWVAET